MGKKALSLICVVVLSALLIGLTACSSADKTGKNPLVGNYYSGTSDIEGAKYAFRNCTMRFNEDGTVQIVDNGLGRESDKRTSYYATYTVNDSVLIIYFGKDEYSGVILEEGSEIRIGSDRFTESDPDNLGKATLEEFE